MAYTFLKAQGYEIGTSLVEEEKVEELYGEILMSAKAPKKEEKGYEYPVMGHVVGLDGKIQGERKRLLHMAGY